MRTRRGRHTAAKAETEEALDTLTQTAVEDLEGGDLVPIIREVLLEVLDHGAVGVPALSVEAGVDDAVVGERVDGLLVEAEDFEEVAAEVGVGGAGEEGGGDEVAWASVGRPSAWEPSP